MKFLHKGLFLATVIVSGSLFAGCPQVGGYTVSWHDLNNAHCNYVSNRAIIGGVQNPTQCSRSFILTDPNYKLVRCKFNPKNSRCVCSIARR